MSATTVSYVHLACDTCGHVRSEGVIGVTTARIAASAAGWKYAEWDTRGKNTYAKKSTFGQATRERRVLPAQWDACPECPLPAGPEEAFGIREKRQQAEGAP